MRFAIPFRRDLIAFLLLVLLAIAASAVCIAFGAAAVPAFTPDARAVMPVSAPSPPQDREKAVADKHGQVSMTYTFQHGLSPRSTTAGQDAVGA